MQRERRRRFIFENHATGFSSQINSPRPEQFPVQGAAALPPGGGVSTARLEGVRFAEVGSASEVSVLAEGAIVRASDANGQVRRTASRSATASLRGFDLLSTLSAERIVGRVAGSHHEDESEARLSIFGSGYQGLVIAGREVEVVFHECLFELERFSDLAKNKQALELLRKQFIEDSKLRGQSVKVPSEAKACVEFLRKNGPIVCSIVREIRGLPSGVDACGNQVYIPQFGNVFLGELMVTPNSRRLTMLRFELGCPYEGCGSGGDVCDDGAWYP